MLQWLLALALALTPVDSLVVVGLFECGILEVVVVVCDFELEFEFWLIKFVISVFSCSVISGEFECECDDLLISESIEEVFCKHEVDSSEFSVLLFL